MEHYPLHGTVDGVGGKGCVRFGVEDSLFLAHFNHPCYKSKGVFKMADIFVVEETGGLGNVHDHYLDHAGVIFVGVEEKRDDFADHLPWVFFCCNCVFEDVDKVCPAGFEDGYEELFLAVEVVIDKTVSNPRCLCDV